MLDRVPQYPGRIKLTPVQGQPGIYDMERADSPSEIGTPLNKQLFDHALAAIGVTAGSATAYTLATDGFTLTDGATIRFRLHVASGANPTINVNATGDKRIMQTAEKSMKTGTAAGTWCVATYSQPLGFFVLRGSGDPEKTYGNGIQQISTYELAFRGHWSSSYNRF